MMKKRTILLSLIALLGVLYAIPWFIAARDVNVILTQMPSPPRTPEAFAEQYPILNAVVWLIRIDIFAAVASGWDPLDMVVEINHHCILNVSIGIAVTLLCVILILHRTYTKRWSRAVAGTAQVILAVLVLLSVGQTVHSTIRHERVVPKWDRMRDTNVLQNHYRFEEMNQDVEVPFSSNGVVLVKSDAEDVHIEVDRRGWLSISNIQLSKVNLLDVIDRKSKQSQPLRFLLWMDRRSKAEDRDAILRLVTNIAPDNTYFVVHDGNHRDMNIVYKGINHNKGIDPYFK
jgi:hypothetical protein